MNPSQDPFDRDADEHYAPGHYQDDEAKQLQEKTGISPSEQRSMERSGQDGSPLGKKALERGERTPGANNDQVGNGYTDGDEPTKRRFWKSKAGKAAAGGIISVMLGGGAFYGMAILSGGAQFLQFGSLVEGLHLQSKEDQGDARVFRLVRYIHYARMNQVEKTRMGILANKYADRIETKLNSSGFVSDYDPVTGKFNGYNIDRESDNFKDMSDDQIRENLKASGVDESRIRIGGDGKITLSTEGLGFFGERRLIKNTMKYAGFQGLSGNMNMRVMGKRAGVNWHFVSRLDAKIRQAPVDAYRSWQEKRKDYAQNGNDTGVSTRNGANEENGGDSGGADETSGAANEAIEESKAATESGSVAEAGHSLRSKIALGTGGALATITGIGCALRGIDDGVQEANQLQVVMPLIRIGMELVSIKSQIQAGEDVDPTVLGYYVKQMNQKEVRDPDTGEVITKASSWNQYKAFKNAVGKDGGIDASDTIKSAGTTTSPFHFLNEGGTDTAFDVVCSSVVQGVLSVVDFLTGPIAYGIGEAVSALLSPLMNQIVQWLAGKPIDENAIMGADYGAAVDYGTLLSANMSYALAGANALPAPALAAMKQSDQAMERADFQSENLGQRLFATSNPRSLFGSVIGSMSPDMATNINGFGSSVLSFGSTISSLGNLFSPKASADEPIQYQYPVPTFGYSAEEMDNPKVENPYQNAEDVTTRILPNNSGYIEKVKNCFGVTLTADGSTVMGATQGEPLNLYDSAYADYGCDDKSDDWLQVRMFIFDSQSADAMSCYYGDGDACTNTGFGDVPATAPGGDATTGAIPTGDTKALAAQLDASPNIEFQTQAGEQAFQTVVQTGQQTNECGQTSTIDPKLLGVILSLSQQYKLTLGVFSKGHVGTDDNGNLICPDTGQHPLGKAVDINGVDPLTPGLTGTGTSIGYGRNSPSFRPEENAIILDFFAKAGAALKASGSGGLGQIGCFTSGAPTRVDGVQYFTDTCNHIHMDVR